MRHDPASQIRLKAPGQQKYAVVKPALDPRLVSLDELAGFALVVGKSEQDDEHRGFPSSQSAGPRARPPAGVSSGLRATPCVHDVSQSHICCTSCLMNLSSR